MTTEIKSPTYPESVSDGTISNWVKKEGESVKQDELIAEIETDKIVLEVLSPIDGKISKIYASIIYIFRQSQSITLMKF